MRIAQLSDIHVGHSSFDERLLRAAIDEVNSEAPDLVAVAGDLTGEGYRQQFEAAREHLDRLECPNVVCVPGNHDARNVGYLHFEDLFGERARTTTLQTAAGPARVVCVDSTKPDLDEGEVGDGIYRWIMDSLAADSEPFARIFVLHHHLVPVPGTGRDRSQLWDAGDVLELLRLADVDLVLAGHRHVPHILPVAGMFLVYSGTASTHKVRGYARPSYNVLTLSEDEIEVEMREPGGDRTPFARYRRPTEPPGEYRGSDAIRTVRREGRVSFDSKPRS